jgi:hypothetical protein
VPNAFGKIAVMYVTVGVTVRTDEKPQNSANVTVLRINAKVAFEREPVLV